MPRLRPKFTGAVRFAPGLLAQSVAPAASDAKTLARYDKKVAGLWNPKLSGDRISFVIVDDSGPVETNLYFEGRVAGDAMQGVIRRGAGADQKQLQWRASRIAAAQ